MSRFLTVLLIFGYTSSISHAYIKTRNSDGKTVRWSLPKKVTFHGYTVNQSSLSSTEIFQSMVSVLESWKDSTQSNFQFDYLQGSDSKTYVNNSDYNQKNSIYFGQLDAGVIGMTQVWFSTSSGEIVETDIELNDQYFYFTKNPNDSTSSPTSSSVNGRRKVYLDSVMAHEMGHAVGLSHESGMNSTMFYQEFMDQYRLGCEERSGSHAQYPNLSGAGSIQGRVLDPNGNPIFGAHIAAISLIRGTTLASVLAEKDGSFSIEGLEPGAYSIMVEPYYPGSSNLVPFYSSINHRVCSSSLFPRQFLNSVVGVPTGGGVSIGDYTVNCASTLAGVPTGEVNDLANPIYIGTQTTSWSVFKTGLFQSGRTEIFYSVDISDSELRLHSLAHGLYSATQAKIRLYDSDGNEVLPISNENPRYSSSGYTNWDQKLEFTGLTPGRYVVGVKQNSVFGRVNAGGMQMVDSRPFFMLIVTPRTGMPFQNFYTDHVKCRRDLAKSDYQSPGGNPDSKKGGCGSIEAVGESGGPYNGLGALLPFALMLFMLRFVRRRFNIFA